MEESVLLKKTCNKCGEEKYLALFITDHRLCHSCDQIRRKKSIVVSRVKNEAPRNKGKTNVFLFGRGR